jgi:phosphatidate phosphatase LPIN
VKYVVEKQVVYCNMFVWNYDAKIVISDVDGTITKSDIRGPFAIKMGIQYYRPGTAALFSSIHKLGYKFLYLTRKPIAHVSANLWNQFTID